MTRSLKASLLGIAISFVIVLWLIATAPVVGFGVAVVIAIAWCVWLDNHPDGGRVAAAILLSLASASAASAQTTAQPAEPTQEPGPADAQPTLNPWRSVKFGATLEGYYQYNWNRPPDRSLVLRAYDTRANTFGIQQAALVVDALPDIEAGRRYGLRVDLQFGQATETVQGSPANEPRPDVYRNIWQAYGTYVFPAGKNGLQADFGKFASMLGYETNYAKDNQAFSRAYLFNFLPFYHSACG